MGVKGGVHIDPACTIGFPVSAFAPPPPAGPSRLPYRQRDPVIGDPPTGPLPLTDSGITTPAEIGAALEMPAAEAVKLLARHQWREGDVALLEAAAARLEVKVSG